MTADFEKKQIDDWHITREIGRGGSGIVFEATRDIHGKEQKAALKLLNRDNLLNQYRTHVESSYLSDTHVETLAKEYYNKQLLSFKSEYKNLINLSHPNIAKAYEFGFHQGSYYICQEYIEGNTLAQTLRGKSPNEMIPYFVQVLEGLDFIHRNGLLHLDIKSENVLVQYDADNNPIVKIIDFGIAIPPKAYKGNFCGSPSYIAPEVAFGIEEEVDARADLFSTAVLFYHCLTWGFFYPYLRNMAKGNLEKIRQIIEKEGPATPPACTHDGGIPEFLKTIIIRLLAKQPDKRFYSNARAVINALITHQSDIFSGTQANYLEPPKTVFIGQDDIRQKIYTQIEKNTHESCTYIITGKQGHGKTYFLNHIAQYAHMYPETWKTITLSLPANEMDITQTLENLYTSIMAAQTGLIVMIDNIHEIDASNELIIDMLAHCFQYLEEQLHHHAIFKTMPSLLLIMTQTDSNNHITTLFQEKINRFSHMSTLNTFSEKQLHDYLQYTPAFSESTIPKEWITNLQSITHGIPCEIVEHLRMMDKDDARLFDIDGRLIWQPISAQSKAITQSTKERLENQYRALGQAEQTVLTFIAIWQWKSITLHASFNDIMEFINHHHLRMLLQNLTDKHILAYDPQENTFTITDHYFANIIYHMIPYAKRCKWHDQIAPKAPNTISKLLHMGYGGYNCLSHSIRHLVALGKQLFQAGNLILAKEIISDALKKMNDSHIKLRIYTTSIYIRILHDIGNSTQALSVFENAIKLRNNDNSPSSLILLPLIISIIPIYIQKRDYMAANDLIRRATTIMKSRPFIIFQLVIQNFKALSFYFESYDGKESSKEFLLKAKIIYEKNEAIENTLIPIQQRKITNNHLGQVLTALGDYNAAYQKLRQKLSRLDPIYNRYAYIATLRALSELCRLTKHFDKAKDYAFQGLKLAKEAGMGTRWRMHMHRSLGNVYHDMDDYTQALEQDTHYIAASIYLDKGNERQINTARLWVQMGHCYKELMKWDQALLYFGTAIEYPIGYLSLISAYEGMGEVCFHTKDYDQTIIYFDNACELIGNKLNTFIIPYLFRMTIIRARIFINKKDMAGANALLPDLNDLAKNHPDFINEVNALTQKISV